MKFKKILSYVCIIMMLLSFNICNCIAADNYPTYAENQVQASQAEFAEKNENEVSAYARGENKAGSFKINAYAASAENSAEIVNTSDPTLVIITLIAIMVIGSITVVVTVKKRERIQTEQEKKYF